MPACQILIHTHISQNVPVSSYNLNTKLIHPSHHFHIGANNDIMTKYFDWFGHRMGTSPCTILRKVSIMGTSHCTILRKASIMGSSHCTILRKASIMGTSHCTILRKASIMGTSHCTILWKASIMGTSHCTILRCMDWCYIPPQWGHVVILILCWE